MAKISEYTEILTSSSPNLTYIPVVENGVNKKIKVSGLFSNIPTSTDETSAVQLSTLNKRVPEPTAQNEGLLLMADDTGGAVWSNINTVFENPYYDYDTNLPILPLRETSYNVDIVFNANSPKNLNEVVLSKLGCRPGTTITVKNKTANNIWVYINGATLDGLDCSYNVSAHDGEVRGGEVMILKYVSGIEFITIYRNRVIDNLSQTDTMLPLSANMGNTLHNTLEARVPSPSVTDVCKSLVATNDGTASWSFPRRHQLLVVSIAQTGTNNPSVGLVENPHGLTVTAVRTGVGLYKLTISGTTYLPMISYFLTINRVDADTLDIFSYYPYNNQPEVNIVTKENGVLKDALFSNSFIEIRLYELAP